MNSTTRTECATGLPRHILYISIRPIAKGEEIYVDYGEDYWEQYTWTDAWRRRIRVDRVAFQSKLDAQAAQIEEQRVQLESNQSKIGAQTVQLGRQAAQIAKLSELVPKVSDPDKKSPRRKDPDQIKVLRLAFSTSGGATPEGLTLRELEQSSRCTREQIHQYFSNKRQQTATRARKSQKAQQLATTAIPSGASSPPADPSPKAPPVHWLLGQLGSSKALKLQASPVAAVNLALAWHSQTELGQDGALWHELEAEQAAIEFNENDWIASDASKAWSLAGHDLLGQTVCYRDRSHKPQCCYF